MTLISSYKQQEMPLEVDDYYIVGVGGRAGGEGSNTAYAVPFLWIVSKIIGDNTHSTGTVLHVCCW